MPDQPSSSPRPLPVPTDDDWDEPMETTDEWTTLLRWLKRIARRQP